MMFGKHAPALKRPALCSDDLDTTMELEQVELRKAFEAIERFEQTVKRLHPETQDEGSEP
jgi:hypothetical protein